MKNLLILLAMMATTACSTITTGQNQSVSVVTDPPKSSCTLNNDKGTWYVNETPGSVTVSRAYGDMSVICKNSNHGDELTGSTTVKSSTKAMDFGNIIFGGVIGAAVDAGTGAGYDYPTTITVPLHEAPAKEATKRKDDDDDTDD